MARQALVESSRHSDRDETKDPDEAPFDFYDPKVRQTT